MFDSRSFDSRSFDSRSWWGLVVDQIKREFFRAASAVKLVFARESKL